MTLTGFKLPIPNLCTVAAAAMLINVAKLPQATPPRVIVVSSMGIGSQHHIMPFALRVSFPPTLHPNPTLPFPVPL